jgi:hypothetical protein
LKRRDNLIAMQVPSDGQAAESSPPERTLAFGLEEQNRLGDFQIARAQAPSELETQAGEVLKIANPFAGCDLTAALQAARHNAIRVPDKDVRSAKSVHAIKLRACSRPVAYAGMVPYYTDGKTTHLLLSRHDEKIESIVDTVEIKDGWIAHWGFVQDKVRKGDHSFAHAAARALFRRLGAPSSKDMDELAEMLVKDFMNWTDTRVMYFKRTQTQVVFWRVSGDVQAVLNAVVIQYKKAFGGNISTVQDGIRRWDNVAYAFRVARLTADGILCDVDDDPVLPELSAAASLLSSSGSDEPSGPAEDCTSPLEDCTLPLEDCTVADDTQFEADIPDHAIVEFAAKHHLDALSRSRLRELEDSSVKLVLQKFNPGLGKGTRDVNRMFLSYTARFPRRTDGKR